MLSSRGALAALASPYGAGATADLDVIAANALARARVGAGADARRLALNLGFRLRVAMDLSTRATVRGRCIQFRWDPRPQESERNALYGIALALAPSMSTPAEIDRLARLLAGHDCPGLRACAAV